MADVLDKVTAEALQLGDSDRIRLANTLLESVEPPSSAEVETAWDREIERRISQIDSGEAEGRPWTDVKRDADVKFPA